MTTGTGEERVSVLHVWSLSPLPSGEAHAIAPRGEACSCVYVAVCACLSMYKHVRMCALRLWSVDVYPDCGLG